MSFVKDKRGSLLDAISIVILPIFLIAIILTFYIAYDATSDKLKDLTNSVGADQQYFNASAATFTDNADKYPAFWDFLFVFLLFGSWIGIMIAAYLLGNNPIFTILYIIGGFGVVITAFIVQSAAQQMIESESLAIYAGSFPMMTFIVNSLGYFSLFFILTIGIALYFKPSQEVGI